MNAKQKTKWLRSEPYLAWVRTLPCVVRGTSPSHAHHMTGYGNRGNTKVHDFWTLPLNPLEHTEAPGCIHQGHETWEAKHGSQWEHVAFTLRKALEVGVLKVIDYEMFAAIIMSMADDEDEQDYCEGIAHCLAHGDITVNNKAALGRENVF